MISNTQYIDRASNATVIICMDLILQAVLSSTAFAWTAEVVGISDGDTITVLCEGNERVKIRLYGVDTPESKQTFGTKAKQFTGDMVHGQTVEVDVIDRDRYGRTVGLAAEAEPWFATSATLMECSGPKYF